MPLLQSTQRKLFEQNKYPMITQMPQFKSLGKLQEHFEIYGFAPKIFKNALLELGVKKKKKCKT
jgi:hypothetical protein